MTLFGLFARDCKTSSHQSLALARRQNTTHTTPMAALVGSELGCRAPAALLLCGRAVQTTPTTQLHSFQLTAQLWLGNRPGGGPGPLWSLSFSLNSGKALANSTLTKSFSSLMPRRKLIIQGHRLGQHETRCWRHSRGLCTLKRAPRIHCASVIPSFGKNLHLGAPGASIAHSLVVRNARQASGGTRDIPEQVT